MRAKGDEEAEPVCCARRNDAKHRFGFAGKPIWDNITALFMATRDEFTSDTKNRLAARVAWRCSQPSCRRSTIGPQQGDPRGIVTAGEAAHITAAAPGGPRYDSTLTEEQRKDISNGIWLCSACADIIDKDFRNYSVATLQQWRQLAERDAHQALVGAAGVAWFEPSTLVGFGFDIVAEAVWLAGSREEWGFGIRKFIVGDESSLRSFIDGCGADKTADFVTVESQGDGRIVTAAPSWYRPTDLSEFRLEVKLPIQPRPDRSDPNKMGSDLALVDGDLVIVDGDLALVSGVDNAKQRIWTALSTPLEEFGLHPNWGSRWRNLAEAHGSDLALLGRLFLLDMARLVNIPILTTDYERVDGQLVTVAKREAPLDFVERVESVSVLELDWVKRETKVRIALRWAGDGARWEDVLTIPLPERRLPAKPPSVTAVGPF